MSPVPEMAGPFRTNPSRPIGNGFPCAADSAGAAPLQTPRLFPGPAEHAAAFIASELGGPADSGLQGRRIVLLGSLPGRSGEACGTARLAPPGELLRLCALLLHAGAQLVVMDRPRSRLLIEALLPLADDGRGHWRGSCLLERDLSQACSQAAALVLLPGWQPGHALPWRALTQRMRPQPRLFDLGTGGCLQRPAALGLRVWHLGAATTWR